MTRNDLFSPNLRHIRFQEAQRFLPRKWVFLHGLFPAPAQLAIVTSRTAGNWGSLRSLLSFLEAESFSWGVETGRPLSLVLLDHPQTTPHTPSGDLKCAVFLHVDAPALALARQWRLARPDLRIVFFLSAEAVGLCPHFLTPPIFPLHQGDLLLTLCQADAQLAQRAFPHARTLMVGPTHTSALPALAASHPRRFIYAGRISHNKNVHGLILAYALARQRRTDLAPLEIYGFQDSSMQQFQETMVQDYQAKLEQLVGKLGISAAVSFHAHRQGQDWQDLLQQSGSVYVSATLNADENYGLAPREFLAAGQRAILPCWGGLRDVLQDYPLRARGIPTLLPSADVVTLDLQSFSQALLEPWESAPQIPLPRPLSVRLQEHMQQPLGAPLLPDPAARELHQRAQETKRAAWHFSGPYRSLHHDPQLRQWHLASYAAGALEASVPSAGQVVPWLSERDGDYHSWFADGAPCARDDRAGLWARGWLYSALPATANSHSGA